jgi:uncharacterized protein
VVNKINIIFHILLCFFAISCSYINRDEIVDKAKLSENDYRLFQNTHAWKLAKAVWDEDVNSIKEITEKEPKLINYQEPKYGSTLLMLTIRNQQLKAFKALLASKADVNIHDTFDGRSAIIEACSYNHYIYDEIYLELLLLNGAKVNDVEVGKRRQYNSTRFTPLMAAAKAGRFGSVQLLIKNGADINYQNEYKQYALSHAIMQENYDIAIFLLKMGADYTRPIFYRPGESADYKPEEDKSMYLVEVLREDLFDLGSKEYKYKMEIVDFLRSKGVNYIATPIPEYIRKKAQEKYPRGWNEYLAKY